MVNLSIHALLLLCWSSTLALARPRTRGVSSSLNRKLSNGGALPSPHQKDQASPKKRRLFLDAFRGTGGYKGGGYYHPGTVYEKVLVKTLVDPDGNVVSSEIVDELPPGYEPPKKQDDGGVYYDWQTVVPSPTPAPSNPARFTFPPTPMDNDDGNDQQGAPVGSPVGPPSSPTNFIDFGGGFTPPDDVVTTTNAPTIAPTPERFTVTSASQEYETIGTVDLTTMERLFFEATESLLTPYLAEAVGPSLKSYKLIQTFRETTQVTQNLGEDSEKLYTNVFEMQVQFNLEGGHDDVKSFGQDSANDIIANFFKDGNLHTFLTSMQAKGVPLRMIREYDPNNSPIPGYDDKAGEGDDSGSDGGMAATQTILIATIVCGAIILFVVLAIIATRRRRARNTFSYGQETHSSPYPIHHVESPLSSMFSSGSSDNGSSVGHIQQSALQKRRMKEGMPPPEYKVNLHPQHIENDDEYYYPDSPYPDLRPTTSKEAFLQNNEGLRFNSYSDDSDTFDDEASPGSPAQFRPENVAQTTLTNLDGEGESLNGLDRTYPEFEMLVNTPKSPEWSEENPYAEENEEYYQQRRRWHGDVGEVDLDALPNHQELSSRETSQRTRSDHGETSRESSIRTRSTKDPWD